jgi:biopolymer transport protein ExbD
MTLDGDSGNDLRSDINVTPLVDVTLVLLVIFMVVTPFLREQLPIDLPSARTGQVANESGQVRLTVSADGSLQLNADPVRREDLESVLRAVYATRAERSIFLEADRGLTYAAVVDLMDTCRNAGIERIGIITRSPGTRSTEPADVPRDPGS